MSHKSRSLLPPWIHKGLIQWVPQLFEHLEFFHVNKSCKIECCGNNTHQIIQNMILTPGLEFKLSEGQLSQTSILYLDMGPKSENLWSLFIEV